MPKTGSDVIDTLAGIAPGSRLDTIRTLRPEARKHAQLSYLGLFEPKDLAGVTVPERYAIAAFVAGLHGRPETSGFYAASVPAELQATVAAEIAAAKTSGPYGAYPKGPLSAEDKAGPLYHVADGARRVLGPRLASAFEHVHMLVFHPRDAAPPSLQALLDAGWSTTDVVTLSQLVAFLSFQIRVVAGLRTLASKL
jgi:CMD domain protein